MGQLLANCGRNEYATVQAWQNFHCLDQQKIIQRRRIANDRHELAAEPAVGRTVALQVFEAVLELDSVRLEKTVDLHSSLECEKPPKLRGGQPSGAVFLDCKGLQRGPGQIRALASQVGGYILGDVKSDPHLLPLSQAARGPRQPRDGCPLMANEWAPEQRMALFVRS